MKRELFMELVQSDSGLNDDEVLVGINLQRYIGLAVS